MVDAATHPDGKRLVFKFDNSEGQATQASAGILRNDPVGISDYLFAQKQVRELIYTHRETAAGKGDTR